jgi:hypothetical protein
VKAARGQAGRGKAFHPSGAIAEDGTKDLEFLGSTLSPMFFNLSRITEVCADPCRRERTRISEVFPASSAGRIWADVPARPWRIGVIHRIVSHLPFLARI